MLICVIYLDFFDLLDLLHLMPRRRRRGRRAFPVQQLYSKSSLVLIAYVSTCPSFILPILFWMYTTVAVDSDYMPTV